MDSSQTTTPLPNHYNVEESENGYTFTTNYGNVYLLTFLNYSIMNDASEYNVFTFNIDRIHFKSSRKDQKIESTILFVLNNFFSRNNDALVLILDSIDGKQQSRNRLFNRWFNGIEGEIHKESYSYMIDEIEVITSLLVGKSNPYINEIKISFKNMCDIDFYHKY